MKMNAATDLSILNEGKELYCPRFRVVAWQLAKRESPAPPLKLAAES